MMRRAFGIALMAALLAVSLPLSVVSAHNGGDDHGKRDKVTICHRPLSARPVTIKISMNAWNAHKAHGDAGGSCTTPTRPPKPAQGTCTFNALTSVYNNGSLSTSPLYATGPIRFSWTVATGLVTVPGGYWNELIGSTTYFNNITSGSVSTTGAVSLTFARTNPNSYGFTGSGQLTGQTFVGQMDGNNYFAATGKVTCRGGSDQDDDD